MATPFDPMAFVERNGVVLAAGRGPVPSVSEAVAGEPIRGSWWGHAKGKQIFEALSLIAESPDVLCVRWIEGKVTFVHRRLWPALVRLVDVIGKGRLAAIRQEHTATGAHRNVVTPFPDWVPAGTRQAAARLSQADALAALGPWLSSLETKRPRKGGASRRTSSVRRKPESAEHKLTARKRRPPRNR